MKLKQIRGVPAFLILVLLLTWPYLLVAAFWIFMVVGAWKGWTK